jgi:hypothetical protein
MYAIAVVREAEPWTGGDIVGGIVLLIVVIAAVAWAIRRYLRT